MRETKCWGASAGRSGVLYRWTPLQTCAPASTCSGTFLCVKVCREGLLDSMQDMLALMKSIQCWSSLILSHISGHWSSCTPTLCAACTAEQNYNLLSCLHCIVVHKSNTC